MKTSGKLFSFLLSVVVLGVYSQGTSVMTSNDFRPIFTNAPAPGAENAIGKFSLSLNPLGFVQFGPIVNAEFGLNDNLVLNLHARFPSLGVLSYVVAQSDSGDPLDEFTGSAFGAGLLYFLGEKKSKPYVGFIIDYQKTSAVYAIGEQWEWYEDDKTPIFACNGGYRFRFNSGFFVNVGAFLGAASSKYDWEYKNVSYGTNDPEPRSGTSVMAFGMLEVSLGIQIK